eukprot:7382301-Prymnesium_polylepis.1
MPHVSSGVQRQHSPAGAAVIRRPCWSPSTSTLTLDCRSARGWVSAMCSRSSTFSLRRAKTSWRNVWSSARKRARSADDAQPSQTHNAG